MEDSDIIALYFACAESAVSETVKKYGAYLNAVAYNILRSREDAEECVSDTWLNAWNAMPPKRPSVLSAFLGKITRNLAFDRWKAAHAEKRGGGSLPLALDELDECIAAKGGVEAAFDEKELSHAIDAFLRTLPERECSIFLRRYWFVDSVRDISERFGINENSVKSILFRTRERLRKHLEREGFAL